MSDQALLIFTSAMGACICSFLIGRITVHIQNEKSRRRDQDASGSVNDR